MNRRLLFTLIIVLLFLTSVLSGCAGTNRISSFFQNNEYKNHDKLIDFLIFFTLFFAMSYLGFTKWFGEGFGKAGGAKGAVIGLSFALSLMLTFALITQTKFSITTLFPLAKAVLFLVFCLLMYGLLHQIIQSDTTTGKIVTFILACILVYILMSIFTHFVCQMSDSMDNSACRSDFFNAFSKLGYRHLWGPGTWFGGSSGSSSAGWQFWPSTGGGGTGTAGGGTIGPGGAPGPSVGPGGAAAGSGGTTGDGGTASRRDAGWPWYAWLFLILLILGIMGYAGLRVARRVQLVRQQNQRINDLIEELRRLIQSKKNILQQINDPTWTAAQRAADHAALTTLLNNLDASPGILRNRPNTGQINTFFAAQAAPNVFQHYRPLTGQQRQVFINNLIQEKNIQYELGQLLNWWRRWFTNRVAQINGLDARLNNLIFSPKFHADMTVELMFDARPIPQFNQNNMPSVAFVAAVPPGVVNPNLMNFHSPGVYNINLGMVVGGPFDYLYNYSVIGAAGWFQTVDILNPVTNVVGGVTTSRFTVQFNPYDTT